MALKNKHLKQTLRWDVHCCLGDVSNLQYLFLALWDVVSGSKLMVYSLQVIHGLLDRIMQLLEIPQNKDGTGYFIKAAEGKSSIVAAETLFYAY